jgi:hypothetical protein
MSSVRRGQQKLGYGGLPVKVEHVANCYAPWLEPIADEAAAICTATSAPAGSKPTFSIRAVAASAPACSGTGNREAAKERDAEILVGDCYRRKFDSPARAFDTVGQIDEPEEQLSFPVEL